jgi:hypothetical protein
MSFDLLLPQLRHTRDSSSTRLRQRQRSLADMFITPVPPASAAHLTSVSTKRKVDSLASLWATTCKPR